MLGANADQGCWSDLAEDDWHLAWLRGFYRAVCIETGGVPGPSEDTDGYFVSYPDVDRGDPGWNTSDVPWFLCTTRKTTLGCSGARGVTTRAACSGTPQSVGPA